MNALVEFEEKLAEVNARAKALKELAELESDTGFLPNPVLLGEFASKLAWANNYLTTAALKLVGDTIRRRREDTELLPGPHN